MAGTFGLRRRYCCTTRIGTMRGVVNAVLQVKRTPVDGEDHGER